MIRLEGVAKKFGPKVALAPLDLEVAGGRIVALVGANGAGKSTALQIASGQTIPDAGRVVIGDRDLAGDPLGARRLLGWLPQDSPLPRALTVTETMEFFAAVRGAPAEAAGLVALAGLQAEGATLVRELSGGMRRKLAFASALFSELRAIVLDEPFAGLDDGSVARFEDALRARRAAGAAVLVSSHDLDRTLGLADEVVVLRSGNVVHRGPVGELSVDRLQAHLD